MDTSRSLTTLRATILLAPFLTAACGGGVGYSAPAAPATTTQTTTATTTSQPTFCSSCVGPPSMGANSDTGIAAGPIAAPPPASFGTASQQTALSNGPTFDGKSGSYPTNVTFPLISTGLQAASTGMSAIAGSPGATATVSTSAGSSTLQLVVPSANINTTLSYRESTVAEYPGDAPTWGYSYVVLGEWAQRSGAGNNSGPIQSEGVFAFGYETPAAAMPTNGTANFSGYADATVFKSVGSTTLSTYLDGTAAVTVNFASGQVTGALTHMQQFDGYSYSTSPGYLPWNDVSVNANIAAGTNRLSGSTAVTSAPGTAFSLSGSATGHVDGAFYGPAAQNLGAVWSLSDGTVSAIGTLGAKQ